MKHLTLPEITPPQLPSIAVINNLLYTVVYRFTGLQVYRFTGLQVYRFTGLQVYRFTETNLTIFGDNMRGADKLYFSSPQIVYIRPDLLIRAIILLSTLLLFFVITPASAQSPLGVAAPDQGNIGDYGFISDFFDQVRAAQAFFYARLVTTMSKIKDNGGLAWLLIAFSFFYGLCHAAGPGHGKAVLASFVVLNRETMRKGVAMAFIASFGQAAMAITLVGAAVYLFNLTSIQIDMNLKLFTIISSLILITIGATMLWRLVSRSLNQRRHRHKSCCGHSHLPPIGTRTTSFADKVSAIISVAIRPCTGAVIVLVFAAAQKIWMIGVISVLAMALGTALTVTVIIIMAVLFRRSVIKTDAGGNHDIKASDENYNAKATKIVTIIEVVAITFIIAIGLIMLSSQLLT